MDAVAAVGEVVVLAAAEALEVVAVLVEVLVEAVTSVGEVREVAGK